MALHHHFLLGVRLYSIAFSYSWCSYSTWVLLGHAGYGASCQSLSAVDAVPGSLSEDDPNFDFLGPVRPDSVAQQVAEGIALFYVQHSWAYPAFNGIVAKVHECACSHYVQSNSLSES